MSPPYPTNAVKRRKIVSVASIVSGVLALLIGLWFVGAYVFGAVIDRIGEPDQSLLFWYLPLLFVGIALAFLGVCGIVFGVMWRRRS